VASAARPLVPGRLASVSPRHPAAIVALAVFAEIPERLGGGFRVLKLLSEDRANYDDAPREGIRRVLEEVTGVCARVCVSVSPRTKLRSSG
jgi:hypothetical protein